MPGRLSKALVVVGSTALLGSIGFGIPVLALTGNAHGSGAAGSGPTVMLAEAHHTTEPARSSEFEHLARPTTTVTRTATRTVTATVTVTKIVTRTATATTTVTVTKTVTRNATATGRPPSA
jgi:hypothetical protein